MNCPFPITLLQAAVCALLVSFTALTLAGNPIDSYYANIEKYADHNAFITVAPRPVSTETGLPLSGFVISVKDNIHVAGMPNTAGTPLMASFVPARDAELVARLRSAGAFIIGKNNLHELAYGITSANRAFGVVHNAINPDYIAGGSSGGTAVAVALGMADAGIGTDTGGSVRIPAALNGLVGFRPTTGRYPNDGMTLISTTRDTAGPITRTVADAQLLDSILSGTPPTRLQPRKLRGLRLGVPREGFYRDLDEDVAALMEKVLQRLQAAGVELVFTDIPGLAELNEKVGFPIVLFETSQLLPAYLQRNLPGADAEDLLQQIASPDVRALVADALAGNVSEAAYRTALEVERPRLQAAYADYFRQNNVAAMVFPTTPLPARPISDDLSTVALAGRAVPTFPTYIRNTDPASNAGIPGISLPAGRSQEELPIGIELDGPEGTDRELLAIALAIETLLGDQSPGNH